MPFSDSIWIVFCHHKSSSNNEYILQKKWIRALYFPFLWIHYHINYNFVQLWIMVYSTQCHNPECVCRCHTFCEGKVVTLRISRLICSLIIYCNLHARGMEYRFYTILAQSCFQFEIFHQESCPKHIPVPLNLLNMIRQFTLIYTMKTEEKCVGLLYSHLRLLYLTFTSSI